MNYGAILVMVFTAVVIIAVINIMAPLASPQVPSEEKCQSIYGYGIQERAYAEKFWCEYNVTGWHFNKTKFRDDFHKKGVV